MTDDTHEAPTANWLGIDVAKASFEAAVHPPWHPGLSIAPGELPRSGFPRTPEGVEDLLSWLDRTSPDRPVLVAMEATGRYSVELTELLLAARPELAPAIVDPLTIRDFGRSLGRRSKTDRADAASIARYGAERRPKPWTPAPPEYARLREMVRQRAFLVSSLSDARNRLEEIGPFPEVADVQRQVIAAMEQGRDRLDGLMHELIAGHPALAAAARRLRTIPGVGPVTVATILGELGPLDRFPSSRSVSAFAGVAPIRIESGTSVRGRSRMSKQGSPEVRRVLYMAAMSAVTKARDNRFARAYEQLVQRGKPRMSALGAIMRRILVTARALVRSQTDYADHFPNQNRTQRP
jgi:transposase